MAPQPPTSFHLQLMVQGLRGGMQQRWTRSALPRRDAGLSGYTLAGCTLAQTAAALHNSGLMQAARA